MERALFMLSLLGDRIFRFWMLVFVITFLAMVVEIIIKRTIPKGLAALSILLIAASLHKLLGFANFEYYQYMFEQLPPQVVVIRYCFSIFDRVISLGAGIGLLFCRDYARKLAIVMSVITLCILPWKHPYYVFANVAERAARQLETPVPNPWYGVVFYTVLDVLFASAQIIYFTRPGVKKHFF